MQFQRIQNAIDLFGQAPPPPPIEDLPVASQAEMVKPGLVAPKLEIAWGGFHLGFLSSVRALFGPRARAGQSHTAFRDSSVEGRTPRGAVVAAALWHFAFLLMPFSLLTGVPHRNPAFQNVEITWRGPIEDLPLLEIAREIPKPTQKPKPMEVPSASVIEAFRPRQRILTDPVRPNHPRQTLINPSAPAMPPKLPANLPNMVQFQQIAGPAKPRMQIDEEMLKKLRPKEKKPATTTAAAPLNMPNMEQHVAEMSLPGVQAGPARPKLQLDAGAAPRVAERTTSGDAGPAPDIAAANSAANGSQSTLIALSANPAPPAPIEPPVGNLAARIAVSPEGTPGVESGAPKSGAAAGASGGNKSSIGVSISGGNPPSNPGSGAKIVAPPRKLVTRPDPKTDSEDVAERTGPPDFASLPPGAKPEAIFASKKVYTLNVNMPNLNSATGSWILNFSELHADTDRRHLAPSSEDLSGPAPLKKIDPKYPPTLVAERVAGEVILYAVIRRDGSVDSIQLVRGIDQQLDQNAIAALRQWRFRPGAKQGTPIELEAIVHIPFRLPEY
jgi:TonB family protein